MKDNRPQRQIKSFVLRQGRLTAGQEEAMATLWPKHGIEYVPNALDFTALFGNNHPVTLEIGFGNGESLAAMAQNEPEQNFIGIEVHTPGVGHLLRCIDQAQLNNLKVMRHDAIDVLQNMIPAASLHRLQLYFPDPWHKTRHHKRRIVQPAFLCLIASRLQGGGFFHMATDWENYAHHAYTVLNQHSEFENTETGHQFSERPTRRPTTKFEQRGHRLGHGVWDLVWRRRG